MPPTARDRALVLRHGWNATAAQALNPSLRRWRADGALVAYADARRWPAGPRVRVAAGEPICAPGELARVARAFEADGPPVLWFGASGRFAKALQPAADLVVGAQPVWAPPAWPGVLARTASLRAQVNRAANKGVRVREAEPVGAAREQMEAVRRAWLATRGLPSLHFLVETDVLAAPGLRRFFVAEQASRLVAFLTLLPVPARSGHFVEWILRRPDAPNGTPALLLDAAFRAVTGSRMLTLGMVPLSTHAPLSAAAPPLHVRALLAWVRAHARRFYDFEGLERFKGKFRPAAWEPLHLVATRGRVGLGELHAVADAFAGRRSPERLVARALASAVAEEARALTGR